MPTLDQELLLQRWGHSFEEDREDARVYRPEGFPFPLARGRDGIEFRPDGEFVEWAIGRGDAGEARPGRWQLDEDGRLHLSTGAGERLVDVVHLDPDRLELRVEPPS